jgi:hypothetical protein
MLYIKSFLSSQGVKVDIIVNPFELKRKAREYDLIHIFNCDLVKMSGKINFVTYL